MADSGQRSLLQRAQTDLVVLIIFLLVPAVSSKDGTAVWLVQKDMPSLLNQTAGDAAASAVKFLNSRGLPARAEGHLELQEVDLSTVKIWNGHDVSLALQVGDVEHRFFSDAAAVPEGLAWVPVRDMLPTTFGGILEKGDWDALEAHLVRPLRYGATLADFTLTGPLDLYFNPPAEVGMWLPHPTEAIGPLKRVLLREGATVTVRGARSAALRRPVDLPSLGVADFVDFAAEEKDKSHAAGILHLAAGLRQKSAAKWNRSSQALGTTPALVSLEIAFSGREAALVAAPGDDGLLQRLKVRRVGDSAGVVELLPSGGQLSAAEGSKALALAKKQARYVWPLRGSSPESVAAYEHVLQEVLANRVFRGGGSSSSGLRPMPDFPLRLQRSTAKAVLLMQLEMAVVWKEIEAEAAAEKGDSGSEHGDSSKGSSSSSSSPLRNELQEEGWSVASASAGGDPPTPEQLLMDSMSLHGLAGGAGFLVGGKSEKKGPEVWSVVVRVEGNARGGLRFVPLQARQVEVQRLITATFSPSALISSMGLAQSVNGTQLNLLAAD